ncbi:MAG: DUF6503 family protein [Flavobacteriaceae bacterium]
MRYLNLILLASLFLCIIVSNAQELTGSQLLDKAINHHDPSGAWASFNGKLDITMTMPDGKQRVSEIIMDLPKAYFKATSISDGVELMQSISKGVCEFSLNGSSEISEEDAKTHRLSCERAHMYKNYYTYLYGLPMKLKNRGTLIDPKTQTKTFNGKEYLVLKVTYNKEVGDDTWYFYFDPQTYAMEVYQFFHDESKNDGEYILLTGSVTVSGIKMPKNRAWYYNKDGKHLGTDVLTKAISL